MQLPPRMCLHSMENLRMSLGGKGLAQCGNAHVLDRPHAQRQRGPHLEVAREPVGELLGIFCNLIVEVDSGGVLQQRGLALHRLHHGRVAVAHAHRHDARERLGSPTSWHLLSACEPCGQPYQSKIRTTGVVWLAELNSDQSFTLCFVLIWHAIGWCGQSGAHVQVAPSPLVIQVLHLPLRDHDGLLEVVEQGCRENPKCQ